MSNNNEFTLCFLQAMFFPFRLFAPGKLPQLPAHESHSHAIQSRCFILAEKSRFPAGQQPTALYTCWKMSHNNVNNNKKQEVTKTFFWYPQITAAPFVGCSTVWTDTRIHEVTPIFLRSE